MRSGQNLDRLKEGVEHSLYRLTVARCFGDTFQRMVLRWSLEMEEDPAHELLGRREVVPEMAVVDLKYRTAYGHQM